MLQSLDKLIVSRNSVFRGVFKPFHCLLMETRLQGMYFSPVFLNGSSKRKKEILLLFAFVCYVFKNSPLLLFSHISSDIRTGLLPSSPVRHTHIFDFQVLQSLWNIGSYLSFNSSSSLNHVSAFYLQIYSGFLFS